MGDVRVVSSYLWGYQCVAAALRLHKRRRLAQQRRLGGLCVRVGPVHKHLARHHLYWNESKPDPVSYEYLLLVARGALFRSRWWTVPLVVQGC